MDYFKQYFTEQGIKNLKSKLETSVKFYNEDIKQEYPFERTMLGFPKWKVNSKEELHGRIMELAQLLNLGLKEEITKEKTSEGEKTIKKIIIKWEQ